MEKLWRLMLGAVLVLIVLNRWVLPWFGIHPGVSGDCETDRCPFCGPGPLNHPTDKNVLAPKGNEK